MKNVAINTRRRYSKPPAIETIIAVHFETPIDPNVVDKFAEKYKGDFPAVEHLLHLHVEPDRGKATSSVRGKKLYGKDPQEVIILEAAQFGYVRLAPYDGWEILFREARRQWDRFRKLQGYKPVLRVSTRTINRIDIPLTDGEVAIDLAKYLRLGLLTPNFSDTISLADFSVGCRWLDTTSGVEHVINLSTAPPALLNTVSLMLDIDVLTTSPLIGRDTEMWAAIDALRDNKDLIFESCITDSARELFK